MINKIILGTVQMGLPYGINQTQISVDDSIRILKIAHDKGVQYLDTAEAYGIAHKLIGKYHTQYPTNKFKIITKFPSVLDEDVSMKIENFLNTLRVESLEAVLFHSYDYFIEEGEDILSNLRELKKQKVIKQIGISVYNNTQFETVISNQDIDIIQLPYNLLDNFNLRGDLLQLAKARNKTIHTRSAFLQGLFFLDPNDDHKIVNRLNNELEILNQIAKGENLEMTALALNYCLQEELIDNVLIGVDSLDQLNQNLSVLKTRLSPSAIKRINEIVVQEKNLLNPSLWNKLNK
jgi:uncharacterized protein